jgi:hypothetical protein
MTDEELLADDMKWALFMSIGDWHRFVPQDIQDLWPTFNMTQRKALRAWAEKCLDQALEAKEER